MWGLAKYLRLQQISMHQNEEEKAVMVCLVLEERFNLSSDYNGGNENFTTFSHPHFTPRIFCSEIIIQTGSLPGENGENRNSDQVAGFVGSKIEILLC